MIFQLVKKITKMRNTRSKEVDKIQGPKRQLTNIKADLI